MTPMTVHTNMHATAIIVGTCGILFIGPSGTGKSGTAFACIDAARHAGLFASLIADDQVLLENIGNHAIATQPAATAGLIELRNSGIVAVDSIKTAVLHMVIKLIDREEVERLPPDRETFSLPCGVDLPMWRLARDAAAPLAILRALMSQQPYNSCVGPQFHF